MIIARLFGQHRLLCKLYTSLCHDLRVSKQSIYTTEKRREYIYESVIIVKNQLCKLFKKNKK